MDLEAGCTHALLGGGLPSAGATFVGLLWVALRTYRGARTRRSPFAVPPTRPPSPSAIPPRLKDPIYLFPPPTCSHAPPHTLHVFYTLQKGCSVIFLPLLRRRVMCAVISRGLLTAVAETEARGRRKSDHCGRDTLGVAIKRCRPSSIAREVRRKKNTKLCSRLLLDVYHNSGFIVYVLCRLLIAIAVNIGGQNSPTSTAAKLRLVEMKCTLHGA